MKSKTDVLDSIAFVVNDRPIAVYGANLQRNTIEYAKTFDASFWFHQLKLASSMPPEEATHDHVSFLRLVLSQAEEHMFSLIFALLQAPYSPDLWLYRYKPSDLPEMVERVQRGEHILNRAGLKDISWTTISKALWVGLSERRYELTAMCLGRLAEHFNSDYSRDEYNGIKHGMRLAFGGISVSFSPGGTPGQTREPDSFVSLGSSMFGSRFYSFKPLSGTKSHFRVTQRASNWYLEVIAHQLRHTVMMIENLGVSLRSILQVEGDLHYKWFSNDDEYELDPSDNGKFFKMEEVLEFDIPLSDRKDLEAVKNSYT